MSQKTVRVYTLDIETDPFQYGRFPKPFAIALYDGKNCKRFWGTASYVMTAMYEYLRHRSPGIIYVHNGGRFDFFYFMKWLIGNPIRIINSRIIRAMMKAVDGWHEFRDSFAIMPFALGSFKGKVQKKAIDIYKLEPHCREDYRAEIEEYLDYDCISLYELVNAFCERFGANVLTIGSLAMRELKSMYEFVNLDPLDDSDVRSNYFYGGRVQAFQKGVMRGNWKVYDVNSMYPHVMRDVDHPIGEISYEDNRITRDTFFVTCEGENLVAFPERGKQSIDFESGYGIFNVTIHEFQMAEKYGLFKTHKVHRTLNFIERGNFAEFVDKWYGERLKAKASGDAISELFAKFILNSCYGKFAQRPENYREYMITEEGVSMDRTVWDLDQWCRMDQQGDDSYFVWSKPSADTSRYNVATGSSITGAARAKLMEGIATADTPLYCDTDSIICADLPNCDVDPKKLGAWKLEATADVACIAGKKLYALFTEDQEKVSCVKQANKGVKITPWAIRQVCQGNRVTTFRDAPSFKLTGNHQFIHREVRMT